MAETEVSVSEDTEVIEVKAEPVVEPVVKVPGKESVKATRGTLDRR